MNTVTLADGRTVPSDSIEWRDECRVRHHHVENMRHLSLQQRRDYLANVERKEGAESAQRLFDAFGRDWEQRKGVA